MENIKTKSVLKYTLLPGIKPRAKRLFGSGFAFFSFLMAQIYSMAGLLPKSHPYLNPANKGRYGVHHVIAEAANNLKMERKNIDKIFIFFALLCGAVLLVAQFVILLSMVLMGTAWATVIPVVALFDTLAPQTDIAFNLLTLVFGVPDFFCSSSAPATCANASAGAGVYASAGAVPYPIHNGLHALFEFYSFGILLIGVLIFLYHLVVVVAETAVTGSPFGRRFQNVWVPIRLVVALGLLVPINFGLNSGQYLALYAAKLGSSIATTGWLTYNNAVAAHPMFGGAGTGTNPMGERETLIGVPKPTSVAKMVEAMSIVHACAYSYWYSEDTDADPSRDFTVGGYHYGGGPVFGTDIPIKPYFVKSEANAYDANLSEQWTSATTFADALDWYADGNIIIRFGEEAPAGDTHPYTGGIKPYCGDIIVPVTNIMYPTGRGAGFDVSLGGANHIHNHHYITIAELWFRGSGAADGLRHGAIYFNENTLRRGDGGERSCDGEANPGGLGLPDTTVVGDGSVRACEHELPTKEWSDDIVQDVQNNFNSALFIAWRNYIPNSGLEIEVDVLNRGWAGAGMWFNRLADINGRFQQAVTAVPEMRTYPLVMEQVREELRKSDPGMVGVKQFSPNRSNNSPILLSGGEKDRERARVLYEVYKHWNEDATAFGDPQKEVVYNIFMDAMNMIFGVDGVFDIRGTNVHTHPLVQLILVGQGMVDSTIRNLGASTASSFMGGLAKVASGPGGQSEAILNAISEFLFSTAFLGLTAGLVLYYIVPFLPFVYFFFAVGVWVKSIFEAMCGIPLWALAHLRLDGDGLPGDSAANGYFLIFEIGIRPILTVFGLVAAIIIFGAQVRVLHFIWDLVVENTAGYNDTPEYAAGVFDLNTDYHDAGGVNDRDGLKRGVIDQFFFTVIYTIIVYMLATASFKLIDMVPDNILRWGGIGVSSFGDQQDDALQGLQRYVAMGGMVQGQQLAGGIRSAAAGSGEATGKLLGLGGRVQNL